MPQSPCLGRAGPARPAGPKQGLPRAPGRATSQSPGPWECPRAPGRRLPEPLGGSPTRAHGSWEWGLEWGFEYVKHHMIELSQLLAFELQLFKTCAPSFSDLSPGREDSGAMHEMSTIASGCLPRVFSNPWQARLYGGRLVTDGVWSHAALSCRLCLVTDGVWLQAASGYGRRLVTDGVWLQAAPVSYTHLTLPTKRIV